jgi:putative ABC transport system permease protein
MVLNFFAGIALLAASFGIVNTLLMSVQERTKEIGLMKAVGMSRKKLFLIFSTEAILLGFWGSLLGSLAGVGVGKVVNRLATKTFLKDLVGFELTSFPAASIVAIMLIIMLIAFLAGTLPARRASKLDAIEALRYE